MSEIATHSLTGASYEIGRQLGRLGADAVHGYLLTTPAWREIAARRGDSRLSAMEELVEECFPKLRAGAARLSRRARLALRRGVRLELPGRSVGDDA